MGESIIRKIVGREGEGSIFGKKKGVEEKAKEAIPPERRKEMEESAKSERSKMIKDVATLLRKEKEIAAEDYLKGKEEVSPEMGVSGRDLKSREKWTKEIIGAEEKFSRGVCDGKVIGTVENILFKKESALLEQIRGKVSGIRERQKKVETNAKMEWVKDELREKLGKESMEARKDLEESQERRTKLIRELKTVTPKEIAKVLGEKEGKTEKVEE